MLLYEPVSAYLPGKAAEAKIHAFIEMLGADARLLTEGEEVKSFDLFAKLTSKKTITGEDEDEEIPFSTHSRGRNSSMRLSCPNLRPKPTDVSRKSKAR